MDYIDYWVNIGYILSVITKADNLTDKRVWVKGLVVGCPYNFSNVECPFKDMKEVSLDRRVEVVNQLSEEQIDIYIDINQYCSKNKKIHLNISRENINKIKTTL